MISIDELLAIQNISSTRSKEPGVPVIPRKKLALLIQTKIKRLFNIKHLNTAVELYCRRGYGIKMNHGKKKYNLIAETVPQFLDWFFSQLELGLYEKIESEFERHFNQGLTTIKLRKYSGKFLYVLEKDNLIYRTNSLEKFAQLHPDTYDQPQALYRLFANTQETYKGFKAVAKIKIKINGEIELTTPPNPLALEFIRQIQDEQKSQEPH